MVEDEMRDTSFFDLIKEQVSLQEYLEERLGVQLVSDGPGRLAACCPFHEEDTPSFKVMESDEGPYQRWWCFGACQEGGTVIDAVMRAEGFAEPNEAARWLNEEYELGLDVNSEAYQRFLRTVGETKADIERARAEMEDPQSKAAERARTYLHNRGLDDATIEHFQLAVDTSRQKAGRLVIPLIDKAGHPVSVAQRALFDRYPCASCREPVSAKEVRKQRFQAQKAAERGEGDIDWAACPHCGASGKDSRLSFLAGQDPKYLFSRDFDKSRFLYGQVWARRALNRQEDAVGLVVVEGYADVWAAHQSGLVPVAYNGAVMSDWQAQAIVELAQNARPHRKPVILVPDADAAGQHNIAENIRKLRAVDAAVEVQVVWGLEALAAKDGSPAKDLGDVLAGPGAEEVGRLVREQRWSAAEWQVRSICETVNRVTGRPFHSRTRQMELVAEVLAAITYTLSLDHLAPYLAEKWNVREEQARNWLHSRTSAEAVSSSTHLAKTVGQAKDEARAFLLNDETLRLGFPELDRSFPGGGLRRGWMVGVMGKSGTGKTTVATQMLANLAEQGHTIAFASLEMTSAMLFTRLAQQTLDLTAEEAEELIKADDPRLAKVIELLGRIVLIDNVPRAGEEPLPMTPLRLEAIVNELNMTHPVFENHPCSVVAIDHIGIMQVDDSAPAEVRRSENLAPGYIAESFWAACRRNNWLGLYLAQLPKSQRAGKELQGDSMRGSSKAQDISDALISLVRKEHDLDLSEEERIELSGQMAVSLVKNRYGPMTSTVMAFDTETLRLLPMTAIFNPRGNNGLGPVIDLGEGSGSEQLAAELTEEGIDQLARGVEAKLPRDTDDLLRQLGAAEDDGEVEQLGNPDLAAWFES